MESNGTSIFVVIFLAVLILSAVLIVWMFVSLVRSELEDERRQMIVGKASTWAFIAVVGGDLIEVALARASVTSVKVCVSWAA